MTLIQVDDDQLVTDIYVLAPLRENSLGSHKLGGSHLLRIADEDISVWRKEGKTYPTDIPQRHNVADSIRDTQGTRDAAPNYFN